MKVSEILKRARGDTYLRRQIAPIDHRVRAMQARLDELAELRGQPAPPSPPAPAPAKPSKKLIADHYRDRPYMATILKAYDGWVADWLGMEQPWYTGPASRWLETHLDQQDHVFEYGAGRSTVWWCKLTGSVVTVEASPEWIAYLNFYVAERPELMAKLAMVHVPTDWNPDAETGVKRYWGRRRTYLTSTVVDDLERKYLQVTPWRAPTVVAFDGSIRALTMAKWALDGDGARGAELVVVDNTEKGRMSSLAEAIVPDYVRLDFPFGEGDVIPEGQNGKHVTTVFVSPQRMERCERGEALPDGADLSEHQLSPDYSPDKLEGALMQFRDRLSALNVIP